MPTQRDTETEAETEAPRYRRLLDVCAELAAIVRQVDALYIGDTEGALAPIKAQLHAPLDALRTEAQREYRRHLGEG